MSQLKSTTPVRSCASVSEEFTLGNATSFGGANLLLDYYCRRLHLQKLFEEHLAVEKAPWAAFRMSDIAASLVAGWSLGMQRVQHFEDIEDDALLALKLGIAKLPDYTILYKDLARFDSEDKVVSISRVNKHILEQLIGPNVILDFDTTVETVFGSQEQACAGYNPRYRGRSSYHPLMVFDGISRSCIDARLRAGNASTTEGFREFYKACIELLPAGTRVSAVRVDRGFAGDEIYSFLENEAEVDYVAKLRLSKGIVERLALGVYWKRIEYIDEIIEVASIPVKLTSWSERRRVVVVRRRLAEDPLQGVLFTDLLWDYEAMVTNLDWNAEDVWRFYNHRCAAENYIKEMKNGFCIDHLPTKDFFANWADLLIKVIAYNSFLAFQKEVTSPGYKRFTISRMRRMFFEIPAILVKHARRWRLKLKSTFRRQSAYNEMRSRLEALA